ncbi:MAG: Com family DNA-binding transcriptional regulator [Burkholderiaceae bacterium]|nr:Com family DNA-binding transcriptional regulator [Burkholderiaceae bacterium]
MQEIRCGQCGRKLGEGDYTSLAIKCPRCRTINQLRATSHPTPERHGAPIPESNHDPISTQPTSTP